MFKKLFKEIFCIFTKMSLTPFVFSNLDNFLDNVFSHDLSLNHRSFHSNMPLDVYETDSAVVVRAHVPGLTKDKVNLSVDENRNLTIEATYDSKFEEQKVSYYRFESSQGTVKRTIRLPRAADVAVQPAASLQNGVLEIVFNKAVKQQSGRKINII